MAALARSSYSPPPFIEPPALWTHDNEVVWADDERRARAISTALEDLGYERGATKRFSGDGGIIETEYVIGMVGDDDNVGLDLPIITLCYRPLDLTGQSALTAIPPPITVNGALWTHQGRVVWADSQPVALAICRQLEKCGYKLTSAQRRGGISSVDEFIYTPTTLDAAPTCSVKLCYRPLTFAERLPLRVMWQLQPGGRWWPYLYQGKKAWMTLAVAHAALAQCRRDHPDKDIRMWPFLNRPNV